MGSWWLAACTSSEVVIATSVPLNTATAAVAEATSSTSASCCSIPVSPKKRSSKEVLEELIRDGTFVHIRRSESVYMSQLLRRTLQRTGNWGSVWIAPKPTAAADLNVVGKILHSDGDYLRLVITATDSTGRIWVDGKNYEMETAAGAFNRQRYPELDPYQDVFNTIANDLAVAQAELSARDRRDLRQVTSLRAMAA